MTTMKMIALFESLTRAHVKDCFVQNGLLYFVVKEGDIGPALGSRGANVARIERALKRKIKIVEFNPDVEAFIRNLVHPLRVDATHREDNTITLVSSDMKTRGLLIGKQARNLRATEVIARRYFALDEIRVTNP